MKRYLLPALAALIFHALAFAVIPLFGGGGEGRGSSGGDGFVLRLVAGPARRHEAAFEGPGGVEESGKQKVANFARPEEVREAVSAVDEDFGRVDASPARALEEKTEHLSGVEDADEVETGAKDANENVSDERALEGVEGDSTGSLRETKTQGGEAKGVPGGDESGDEVRESPSVGEGDGTVGAFTPPILLEMPEPEYPRFARKKGYDGLVVLEVTVSPRGSVSEVLVLKSSGHKILDERAVEAAKRARFEPARLSGVPVESRKKIAVRFVLE